MDGLDSSARGPLDAGCEDEGAIVCHNGRIKGQQGVALDDLVYIMTRMARQMEAEGVSARYCCGGADGLMLD